MDMSEQQQGLTLIELLMTMAVMSILFGLGLPSFDGLMIRSKVSAEQRQLVTLLNSARQTAVLSNQVVTICPSAGASRCLNGWSEGYLAFIDENADRSLDPGERIIFQFKTQDENIHISWRAFGHKQSLQWLPSGITNHQNGSFEICYKNEAKYARALILTKTGRIRRSKDTDGDEIHENSRGQNISC